MENNRTTTGDQTNAHPQENEYTPEETPFADGEGTKLDSAIDDSEENKK